MLAAGCSSGSAAKTMSDAQMCGDLSDLHNLFAQVGYDGSLAATRSDLSRLVATAEKVRAAHPPQAVTAAVTALAADLKAVDRWVQTKATQSQLESNALPASVKGRFDDVGNQYKKIDSWSAKNCR